MNYSIVAFGLMSLFVLSSGCKSSGNDSRVRADFIDKRPSGDETWTEARMDSLEKYAYDLMTYSGNEKRTNNELEIVVKDHFKSIGVTDYKPLNSYKIKLGTANECFWEGTSDYDLWWPNHIAQMKSQIEQVAIFVKDFHLQTLGAYDGAFAFKEVLVCPQSMAHQEIEWLICQNLYNRPNERQRSIRPDPGHLIPVVG